MADPVPATRVPDADRVYRVPYRLTDTKHLLVRARINGKGPFNFIVDTGAPALFMSTDAAKKAGVPRTADGWGTCDRVLLEGGANVEKVLARIDQPAQLRAMNATGLPGAQVDGVLGYTLLAHFRMEIDLTRAEMHWTRLNTQIAIPIPIKAEVPDHGKPEESPKGVQQMEGLANLASLMMKRQAGPTVILRGFLGLELADTAGAVRVRSVLPESPAAKAGVKAGDRIASVAVGTGKLTVITSSAGVLRAARTSPAGEKLRFKVTRGVKPLILTLVAGGGL